MLHFFLWPMFHCTDIPCFVYPFIRRWTFGLLSLSVQCKQSCNEHWCPSIFLNTCFQYFLKHIPRQGIASFEYKLRNRIPESFGNPIFNLVFLKPTQVFAWTLAIGWFLYQKHPLPLIPPIHCQQDSIDAIPLLRNFDQFFDMYQEKNSQQLLMALDRGVIPTCWSQPTLYLPSWRQWMLQLLSS